MLRTKDSNYKWLVHKLPPVLLVFLCLGLEGCLFPEQLAKHREFVAEHVQGSPVIIAHDMSLGNFNLHYRSRGTPQRAVAVWVHGTPGGWADIGRLLLDDDFTDQVMLVSVDRPGWGASRFLDKPRAVPTFDEQSRLISPLIQQLHGTYPNLPLILVGHSWGASLIPGIAADNSGAVDAVLALAGPFDPDLAAPRWYNRAASTWAINRIIGEDLRRSNVEMYALPDELRLAAAQWQTLNIPIIVLHGETDQLVPVAHLDFAKAMFPENRARFVTLRDQGHLLQIERWPLIGSCILALAAERAADCADAE